MSSEKLILCGIDLGPDTGPVLSYAAGFAAALDCRVRLLYVIDYLLTPPAYMHTYLEEEKKREEGEMKKWAERLSALGITTESSIITGRLHESFTSTIEESRPDLMVIGYKSHMLRPSSSERLIMTLKVPMLVVRPKPGHAPEPGSVRVSRVLCPVDFSENSRKALAAAGNYARAFGAELTVINVVPSHLIKDRWAIWGGMDEDNQSRFDESMYADATSTMASFCTAAGLVNAHEILQGDPGGVITSFARERDFDLVVIGARGLSFLQSIIIGSTTIQVLKSSPCPVLVVH